MVALVLLLACGTPEEGSPSGEMPAVDLLTRASLDLRGTRPTVAELDRVEADPAAVDALIDDFLLDPRFEPRVRELFAEVFLTRTETYPFDFSAFELDEYEDADVLRSIGDEPLRVLGRIAAEDLPITELVTADWTMANPILARMWPVDYPAGGDGWEVVQYTDGRPAAGVLASHGLWWRYTSTDSNANRKRANAASRILLCHDYLTRPIEFDRNVDLLDEEAVAQAVREDPGCVSCHASLDPFAAYFFGFQWTTNAGTEIGRYHPSRERGWQDVLDTPPAYYGQPGSNLADLGWQIAADNRFPECMVEHVWTALLRRDAELLDFEELVVHRDALIHGDLALRPLFRSVVDSAAYRAVNEDDSPAGAVPKKQVTADQLASQVEDLTGFRFRSGAWDLLTSDLVGYLTLAGGADGVYATRSATSPNATLLLVQQRLAEGAASFVVAEDLADPGRGRLLTRIDGSERPGTDRAVMAAQVQDLHWRLFGHRVAADGPEVEANLALWSDLYEVDSDADMAWAGLVTALLRDPDFLFY